jgi:hypothetical protein
VPVPRPEHLAAFKVVALKNDPSRAFRDQDDLRSSSTFPASTRTRSGEPSNVMASESASMKSSEPLDLPDLERDIPTTPDDIQALRRHRPRVPESWWDALTAASEQLPGLDEARRRRKTFAGFLPFEL